MLKKESKIRVLENFYAVDYVFFGKPVAKVDSCCPLVKEEYLSIKGALMSVFIEMLKMIDHQPKPLKEFVDSASLVGISKNTARIAREAARKIIATPKSRQNIKESVSQVMAEDKKANVSQVIEQKITEKAFSIAVDALLIGRTLREAKDYKKLNEWEGRILEDSYKILRDSLVESAYQILDGKTDEPKKKIVNEDIGVGGSALIGALIGLLIPVPGGLLIGAATGAGIGAWKEHNKEKIHHYCAGKFQDGSPKYHQCLSLGDKAMTMKLAKAKSKVKSKKN